MPEVTFLPVNKTVSASEGQTLLDVALKYHIDMDCACGGFCACCTCRVEVVQGMQSLSVLESEEWDRLSEEGLEKSSIRLACQAKVQGDVVVQIPAF